MIHFKLKNIEDILPSGEKNSQRISWFWLADGALWLQFGESTIYEYTSDAQRYFGNKPIVYNDYPLARFIEDFTETLDNVRESIPEKYYKLIPNLRLFLSEAKSWLDTNESNEEELYDFYFSKYDKLVSWTYKRSFDSGHLIGGPVFYFFRKNNKISIIWESEAVLENNLKLWTSPNGYYEIDYNDFVSEVKKFGERFFLAMQNQVNKAIEKDWGEVEIDKAALKEEHQKREVDFYTKLKLLEEAKEKTNWEEVDELFEQMKKVVTKV